jgi:hypothetical protein
VAQNVSGAIFKQLRTAPNNKAIVTQTTIESIFLTQGDFNGVKSKIYNYNLDCDCTVV